MSDKRLRTLHRILSVQEQLRRTAETKLAGLQRRERELNAAQAEIIAALNGNHHLHGLFVAEMSRSLGKLAKQADDVRAAKDIQGQELRDRTGMVRQAERRVRDVSQDSEREIERSRLEDVLERLARN